MESTLKFKNYNIQFYSEGNGEILLFLHGWPNNSRLWDAQKASFSDRFQVVTFDFLGFGKSDKPISFWYTFSAMKEMIDVIISHVSSENQQINIVAHDIGGPPAIIWASEHYSKINRFILLNTILYPFSTFMDKSSHMLFTTPGIRSITASRFGIKLIMHIMTKNWSRKLCTRMDTILDFHKNPSDEVTLKTILEPMKEGRENEVIGLAERFQNLPIRRYLIMAKQDPLCYKHISTLQKQNPDILSFTIGKCGHLIPIDKPMELNEILEEILSK